MGSNAPGHPLADVINTVRDGQWMAHAIGLATMRVDGFASMDAYREGGTLTTKPLVFNGERLEVNLRAPERPFGVERTPPTPYGTFSVELLDRKGRTIEPFSAVRCDTLTGDELRHTVTWNGSPDVTALAGETVRAPPSPAQRRPVRIPIRQAGHTAEPGQPARAGGEGNTLVQHSHHTTTTEGRHYARYPSRNHRSGSGCAGAAHPPAQGHRGRGACDGMEPHIVEGQGRRARVWFQSGGRRLAADRRVSRHRRHRDRDPARHSPRDDACVSGRRQARPMPGAHVAQP